MPSPSISPIPLDWEKSNPSQTSSICTASCPILFPLQLRPPLFCIYTLIPTSSLPSTYKYIKNTSTYAYFSLPRNVLHQRCNPHSLPTFKSKLSNTYTPTIRQLCLTLEFTAIWFTPTPGYRDAFGMIFCTTSLSSVPQFNGLLKHLVVIILFSLKICPPWLLSLHCSFLLSSIPQALYVGISQWATCHTLFIHILHYGFLMVPPISYFFHSLSWSK